MTTRNSVYIIYTGGTIGMKRSNKGYVPAPGFIKQQMAKMPEFSHPDMPRYTIYEFNPLLDSSNITSKEWVLMGEEIARNYHKYDGFVILHGTDTMAYTASALSFMFENLSKPIILTGSQSPLVELRTDAHDNLINALHIASHYTIPEVCLFFNHRLFRGNRVRKIHADSYAAFRSPNYLSLAEVGTDITIHKSRIKKPSRKALHFSPIKPANIAVIRLFPGLSVKFLDHILQSPLQGLILETYGTGNAPDLNPDFLKVLKGAIQRGVIVVNCTQCLHGSVRMARYATGNALHEIGVVSAHDMTPEAAITKLYYLFSHRYSNSKIKSLMQKDLRGELTA